MNTQALLAITSLVAAAAAVIMGGPKKVLTPSTETPNDDKTVTARAAGKPEDENASNVSG